MRIAAGIAALSLAACGSADPPAAITNGAAAPEAGAPDRRIDCRAEGEAGFARICSVESADTADGRILTIRKADGGFRRLRVTTDGRGVVAADGAERTHVTILSDGRIEVEIGGDRFRLPGRAQAR
jgi:hypothetical protein